MCVYIYIYIHKREREREIYTMRARRPVLRVPRFYTVLQNMIDIVINTV